MALRCGYTAGTKRKFAPTQAVPFAELPISSSNAQANMAKPAQQGQQPAAKTEPNSSGTACTQNYKMVCTAIEYHM